jgi:hypothetical protein
MIQGFLGSGWLGHLEFALGARRSEFSTAGIAREATTDPFSYKPLTHLLCSLDTKSWNKDAIQGTNSLCVCEMEMQVPQKRGAPTKDGKREL